MLQFFLESTLIYDSIKSVQWVCYGCGASHVVTKIRHIAVTSHVRNGVSNYQSLNC